MSNAGEVLVHVLIGIIMHFTFHLVSFTDVKEQLVYIGIHLVKRWSFGYCWYHLLFYDKRKLFKEKHGNMGTFLLVTHLKSPSFKLVFVCSFLYFSIISLLVSHAACIGKHGCWRKIKLEMSFMDAWLKYAYWFKLVVPRST